MESTLLIAIIAFIAGCVLASLITWLALKMRTTDVDQIQYQLESTNSELNQKSDELIKLDNANQALKIDRVKFETALNEKVDSLTRAAEDKHELEYKLEESRLELTDLKEKRSALVTQITNQEENFAEQKQQMLAAHEEFKTQFESLASRALKQNNESFLNTANEVFKNYQQKASGDLEQRQQNIEKLVKPVEEQLGKVTEYVTQVDKEREGAYKALLEQVDQMKSSQSDLKSSTSQLVNVLSNAKSRGQWGEIQLRRVVEIAGMTNYSDFDEQVHQAGSGNAGSTGYSGSGGRSCNAVRPDLVVSLPGERLIVVDAKAPMDAYWQAHDSDTDSERDQYFASHAKALRSHVGGLAAKKYQDSFEHSPEFVVLFLPNEAVYSTALEYDRGLIDAAASDNVIIATPTTLIALLKAVAYGWRQEKIADEVRKFTDLGREFYARLAKVTEHISKVGTSLDKTVDNYNSMIGSIERRLVPTARKFHDSSLVGDNKAQLEEPTVLDRNARVLGTLPELDGEKKVSLEEPSALNRSALELESKSESETDSPVSLELESHDEAEDSLDESMPVEKDNTLNVDLDTLADDFEDEFGGLRIAEKASGGGDN